MPDQGSVTAARKRCQSAEIGDPGGVNSVEVAGGLLRVLAEAGGPMRLADLSRAAAMPSAKAHRYLVSLARAGLVEQDAETARYDLGPLMLRAGLAALGRSDALKRAERALEAIAARTGETAAVAVWGTHGPTHVRLVEARHELAATVPPGHVCPMTYSAAGLVFCAFGDPPLTAPLAEREMAQSRAVGRPGAPTTSAELERLVEAVRAQGFAAVANEGEGGLAAVSAPVFDADGARLRLALTVFGRAGRLNTAPDGPVAALMVEAARSLGASCTASRRRPSHADARGLNCPAPELPRLCRGHRRVVRVACRRHEAASDARRPRRGLRGRACPGSPVPRSLSCAGREGRPGGERPWPASGGSGSAPVDHRSVVAAADQPRFAAGSGRRRGQIFDLHAVAVAHDAASWPGCAIRCAAATGAAGVVSDGRSSPPPEMVACRRRPRWPGPRRRPGRGRRGRRERWCASWVFSCNPGRDYPGKEETARKREPPLLTG